MIKVTSFWPYGKEIVVQSNKNLYDVTYIILLFISILIEVAMTHKNGQPIAIFANLSLGNHCND